jgi:hypothetical protein
LDVGTPPVFSHEYSAGRGFDAVGSGGLPVAPNIVIPVLPEHGDAVCDSFETVQDLARCNIDEIGEAFVGARTGVTEGIPVAAYIRVNRLDENVLAEVPRIHELPGRAVSGDEFNLVGALLPEEGKDALLGSLEGYDQRYTVVSLDPGIQGVGEGCESLFGSSMFSSQRWGSSSSLKGRGMVQHLEKL